MTNEQCRDLCLNIERFANEMQFVCVDHCKRTQYEEWAKWGCRFDKFSDIFNKALSKWHKHSREVLNNGV